MNNDKAYLMGLIVGGGSSNSAFDRFDIKLPYRQWGSVMKNPKRAGQIGTDIMTLIRPIFEYEYGLSLSYEHGNRDWVIRFHGDLRPLRDDLSRYGLRASGEFRHSANIRQLKTFLHDENLKRHFIAGLADTIGSLTASHRRFTDGYQIISFEFSGSNYQLVQQICQMLHEIGSYPDQVLWNHPNQHSSNDAYYTRWKKGFKIRVLLDQYTQAGSFFSQAKMEGAIENQTLSEGDGHYGIPCPQRHVNITVNASHIDENSSYLPPEIRGYHYLHTKHFCAVLGCPFAPEEQLRSLMDRAHEFVSPFTILTKGTVGEIEQLVKKSAVMSNGKYVCQGFDLEILKSYYLEDGNRLLWGSNRGNGYPVSKVLGAIAYVTAGAMDRLHGKRVRGNMIEWLNSREVYSDLPNVEILKPDCLTPLIVRNKGFACLVGPLDPETYKGLLTLDDSFRLLVRNIEEDDLE
jgi:hypothetical protein